MRSSTRYRPLWRLIATGIASAATLVAAATPARAQAQGAASAAGSQTAPGQKPIPEFPPDTDYAQPKPTTPPAIPATQFLMPDGPDEWSKHTSTDNRLFSATFSFVSLVDYNAFAQDENSKAQVGAQDSQWDLRTMRLMGRGVVKFRHPVGYFVSLEVKGQDHVQTGASKIGLTDLEVSTQVWKLGQLKYGKIKEPFVYEMVGDAANLPQQERALSPFFASRGLGVRLVKPFAHDAMSVSLGWFNDWWTHDQAFKSSGNDFAGRLTALPVLSKDGGTYLHLAVDVRYIGADDGVLVFRGRPESNVTSYYVDSGKLTGQHADELGIEGLWNRGPFSLTGDWARSRVAAPASGDPVFWGGYIVASYVLTGEHRRYDPNVAYARRVLPRHEFGAFELVGRYSHVDLDDAAVQGGIFDRTTVGLNWWATRRWKVGVDYGYISLDRDGLTGVTHAVHVRMQWVY
jgi:phosphate-selective porin OprO/OprP